MSISIDELIFKFAYKCNLFIILEYICLLNLINIQEIIISGTLSNKTDYEQEHSGKAYQLAI